MSFVAFTVETPPPAWLGTGISVSLRGGRRNKTGKSPVKFVLALNSSICGDLGWEHGQELLVLLGEGEQHGLLRLQASKPDNEHAAKLTRKTFGKGNVFFQLNLGFVPQFVERGEKKQFCQWEQLDEKDGGGIEIALPGWADETAPKSRKTMAGPTVRDGKIVTPAAARVRDQLDAADVRRSREMIEKNKANFGVGET